MATGGMGGEAPHDLCVPSEALRQDNMLRFACNDVIRLGFGTRPERLKESCTDIVFVDL